jgi:hypothetical protein
MWRYLLIGYLAACALYGAIAYNPPREPDVCSNLYRNIYLEMHDSDAALQHECPFGFH